MITIWTYDRVPGGAKGPRGFVRDLRLRWACEEAGIPYRVATVPFENRQASHFARQPYGQVPFLDDGDIRLFESGACLLHLAEKSPVLMPGDAKGRAEVLEWTIAALNSVEMVSVPWVFIGADKPDNPLSEWFGKRLAHTQAALGDRPFIAAGRFTAADIILGDVLRQTAYAPSDYPGLTAYVDRLKARPAFRKAHDDQVAHFIEGDRNRT